MSLPLKQPWDMAQTTWSTQLNPVISNEIVNGLLLQSVALNAGMNVINHTLGRKLVGWFPTRIRASATFYDQQDSNQTPALTLNLVSSAAVVADLWVY